MFDFGKYQRRATWKSLTEADISWRWTVLWLFSGGGKDNGRARSCRGAKSSFEAAESGWVPNVRNIQCPWLCGIDMGLMPALRDLLKRKGWCPWLTNNCRKTRNIGWLAFLPIGGSFSLKPTRYRMSSRGVYREAHKWRAVGLTVLIAFLGTRKSFHLLQAEKRSEGHHAQIKHSFYVSFFAIFLFAVESRALCACSVFSQHFPSGIQSREVSEGDDER